MVSRPSPCCLPSVAPRCAMRSSHPRLLCVLLRRMTVLCLCSTGYADMHNLSVRVPVTRRRHRTRPHWSPRVPALPTPPQKLGLDNNRLHTLPARLALLPEIVQIRVEVRTLAPATTRFVTEHPCLPHESPPLTCLVWPLAGQSTAGVGSCVSSGYRDACYARVRAHDRAPVVCWRSSAVLATTLHWPRRRGSEPRLSAARWRDPHCELGARRLTTADAKAHGCIPARLQQHGASA